MTDPDRDRWDRRYAGQLPVPLESVALPTVFAPYVTSFPTTGYALELACGRGEASAWMARRGLSVLGVDISPVAIGQAQDLARRAHLAERCHFEAVDLDGGLPAGPAAEVIVCNKFRDSRLDGQILSRLAPGGLLAICVLSAVGGPSGPYRAQAGELMAAFGDLESIASGEGDGQAWLLARRT